VRFAIDAWSPEYGVAADAGALEETHDRVDAAVEVPIDQWGPISPEPAAPPSRVAFIDGVRRIEARVWISHGDVARPGVCASVAAGVVFSEPGRARVEDVAVRRGVFAAPGEEVGPIVTRHGTYEFVPTAGDTPEALYAGIHEAMTALESDLAGARLDDVELVVFDGPLRGRQHPRGVGSVKTHDVAYLPDEVQPVIGRLGPGQRTPLFLIGGFTRWSWYLRLPGPIAHPWSGVIRCELPGLGRVDDAVSRADQISALLPRFASEPHKDPRAPQNLYPIAGLEHELRRRLGDPLLLERALRVAAADQPTAPG
jgi:hypothetical protein